MIGLPSLRALDGAQGTRIWLAAEATDMRCGFDRLAERVRLVIGQDPLGNSRLSAGSRSVELRASELAMILDGIDVSKLKREQEKRPAEKARATKDHRGGKGRS
jgi:transposase